MSKRGILAIVGGMCLHMTLGNLYLWGGISMYCSSYLYHMGDHTASTRFLMMFLTIKGLFQCILSPVGIYLERRIGHKIVVIMCAIIWMSSFCPLIFTRSKWWYLGLLGVGFGVPDGLGYTLCFVVAWRHFPDKTGLVTGIIGCAYGSGSCILNIIAMQIVNPQNHQPIYQQGTGEKYFSQEVANHVPTMWMVLVFIWGCLLLLAILFIRNPTGHSNLSGGTSTPKTLTPKTVNTVNTVNIYRGGDLEETVESVALKTVEVRVPWEEGALGNKYTITNNTSNITTSTNTNTNNTTVATVTRSPKLDEKKYITGVKEGLSTPQFWILNYIFNVGLMTNYIFAFCYKPIGQNYGFQDRILTIIGTIYVVILGLMRIPWGYLFQIYNFKTLVFISSSGMLFCTLLIPFIAPLSIYIYAALVLLNVTFAAAIYPLIPSMCNRLFGPKYGGQMFSFIYEGVFIVSCVLYFANYYIPLWIGYAGYLIIPTIANSFSLLLIAKLKLPNYWQ